MTHLNRFILTLAVPGLLAAVSCESLTNAVKGTTGTTTSSTTTTGRKSRDVLPQDRKQFFKDKASPLFTPEGLRQGQLTGDWAIEEVYGSKPEFADDRAPYLRFNHASGQFYGNNGCNYISGKYVADPSQKLIGFDDVVSTMMVCEGEISDIEINRALSEARTYDWEESPSMFRIRFLNASGEVIMVLAHQTFDFLNGTWTVKALNDAPINTADSQRLVLDVDNRKVHGNTGCNILNGTLLTNMDAPNSISFQNLTLTQKSCPEIDYEMELLVALEDVSSAKPISANKVNLYNNHGVLVLELERTTDR